MRTVTIPRELVRNAIPTAGSDFQKFSQSLEFRVTETSAMIELHLAQAYNTHWEVLSGRTRDRTVIRIQYLEDAAMPTAEEADIVVVLTGEGPESDEERMGRVLTSDANFFEVRFRKELVPLLVNIVDTFNKAHFKKIPTTVNTYKAEKVKMVEDDDNLPMNSFFASLLRNVPGVSEDVAKALTRHFNTVEGLIANLDELDNFRFQASAGNSRALTRPVVERLRALFDADARGSDVLVSGDLFFCVLFYIFVTFCFYNYYVITLITACYCSNGLHVVLYITCTVLVRDVY